MVYDPIEIFDPRLSLVLGVIYAAVRAAIDFVSGDNKPWAYYLGSAFGGTALATGIPNAAATLYVVGETVDFALFKSPDGSDVRLFLNGIEQAQFDAYALTPIWATASVVSLIPNVTNRIDIVNVPNTNPDKTSTVNWLAIGPVTVNGGTALEARIPMDTIVFRIADSEQDSPLASFPVSIPSGKTIVQIQAYADAIIAELDAVTGGKIVSAEVTVGLDLASGIKSSADSNILNERGGLISFDTSGPRGDSVRIPAIKYAIMPGDSFLLTNTAVAALITRLTTSSTAGTIRPVTPQAYNWVTAKKGAKSFRRK